MTALAAIVAAGCAALSPAADRITLADLAPAFPGLHFRAPETPVSYAPAPGVRRIFRAAELTRLAVRFNLDAVPQSELCFERRTMTPDPARMREAMLRALPAARIEILDYSRQPAPEGEFEFSAAGLRRTSAGAVWAGSVRYSGSRHFPVWAKVKLAVPSRRVVAAADLPRGRVLDAADLRVEELDTLPAGSCATEIEQVAGRSLRRTVRAGAPIETAWLEIPKEVNRGDVVRVEVRSGGTLLEMEGRAEASGAIGDTIPVSNPSSKKVFRARIEGKGKVSVGL
jgi:flagella basal body P-ring formation protein FlgA